jgi:hypothetical protein
MTSLIGTEMLGYKSVDDTCKKDLQRLARRQHLIIMIDDREGMKTPEI